MPTRMKVLDVSRGPEGQLGDMSKDILITTAYDYAKRCRSGGKFAPVLLRLAVIVTGSPNGRLELKNGAAERILRISSCRPTPLPKRLIYSPERHPARKPSQASNTAIERGSDAEAAAAV